MLLNSSKGAIFLWTMLPALGVFSLVQPALADMSDGQPAFSANNNSEETISQKWLPYLHLTTKTSDDRQLGRIDFMYPLWQSSDSMIFSDIRSTFDDDDSFEGNLGLGFRRIMQGAHNKADWIWGVYGFYDYLKSPNNNRFDQGTLGAELLKTNFELRGNIYIPEDTSHVIGRMTVGSVSLSGTTVMERT